jgi:glycosyltransferase involved in cell wall biosynthesis
VVCEDWPRHAPDYDEGLLSDIREVEVHRIPSYGPCGMNRFFIRNLLPWLFPHKTPYNWWKLARMKAFELCESNSFDAIVATHDPLATLSIASELSQCFGIPWIADIRDSWNVQKLSSPRKQKLIAKHESSLSSLANEVVSVSEGISDELGRILGRRIHTISNGFDQSEIPPLGKAANNAFTILYAGNLSHSRNPRPLFKAIEQCVSKGLVPEKSIEVCFLGSSETFVDHFDLRGFKKVSFSFHSRVSRRKALSRIRSASILLVLSQPNEKGVVTGKVFDYLSSGRPILAVPDDSGEIKRLLESTKTGVSLSDPNEIALQLAKWFEEWKKDKQFKLDYDESEIRKHSRERKTEELVEVLESLR